MTDLLDKFARIDTPFAMVYIKPEKGESSIAEHGKNTVTYVPDGTTVAVSIIDPKDAASTLDTAEVSAVKLDTRIEKLLIKVDAEEFIDIEDYKVEPVVLSKTDRMV